jgi:hypothetical protein
MQYGHIQHSVIEMEALAHTFPGVDNKKIRTPITNNNNNNYKEKKHNKSNIYQKTYFCSKHGNGNHSTDRCCALKATNKKDGDSKKLTTTDTKNNKPIICYTCKEPGHISINCPNTEDQVKA